MILPTVQGNMQVAQQVAPVSNVAATAAAAVAAAAANQSNIVIPGMIEMVPVPDSMTQTIASATGGGSATITGYFGNEDAYNATVTNNGSGANSVVTTYSDGWSGKGYNRLFYNGQGVKFYGFTMGYVTTSSGAQLPAGLANANPTILFVNLVNGQTIPRGIPLAGGVRNTQYLSGTMTVVTGFRLNSVAQFSYVVPVGATATLTLITTPL